MRAHRLLRIPLTEEDRDDRRDGPFSAEAIDRLAATIRIADPEPVVH